MTILTGDDDNDYNAVVFILNVLILVVHIIVIVVGRCDNLAAVEDNYWRKRPAT